MIKIIIHITKFIIVAITSLLFASCNFNVNTIEGSGNVTTEKRLVEGEFTKISVSNAIDLVIEQSENTQITVEADDNLLKDITTKVENGTLVISSKFSSFRNVTMKKVTVKIPIIEEIKASSASTVSTKNVLQSENIDVKSSSAATMNLNLESDNITIEASSGSSVSAEGKALKMNVKASSGSSVNTTKLLVNDVDAKASSGASINVHPIVNLKAKASSGASVNYDITPKSIEKSTGSGGSINRE